MQCIFISIWHSRTFQHIYEFTQQNIHDLFHKELIANTRDLGELECVVRTNCSLYVANGCNSV